MAYNDPLRDITREMLDKMYEKDTKKIINERFITEEFGEKIELKEDELKEEEKKFRSTVSPRVEFNNFFIYPNASNVEWSGKFNDSDLEWVFSLDDSTGVYISGDLVRLNDNTMDVLKKLTGYYETWSNEWANKLADEYPVNNKEEEGNI
jgi:hypothetical protein